jgi:hypothetical protein
MYRARGHVGFNAAQKIGHQIMALTQLHINVAKGLTAPLPGGDEGVVAPAKTEKNDGAKADHDPNEHGKKSRQTNVVG